MGLGRDGAAGVTPPVGSSGGVYHVVNVRDPRILGGVIGRQIVDVTQHDPGEPFCLHLLLDDGTCLSVPVGDGGFRVTYPTSGA